MLWQTTEGAPARALEDRVQLLHAFRGIDERDPRAVGE